jgi:hypothetical protein
MAQVNISENINPEHLGKYRGGIKKAYKEIEAPDKVVWDEMWDLELPLYKYENKYLLIFDVVILF